MVLPSAQGERVAVLERDENGLCQARVRGVQPGDRYSFLLDGATRRPDPASRWQPEGVHSDSEVVDPEFTWNDSNWKGIALDDLIFYELHPGTFTPEGTFDAIIPHLPELKSLGITSVALLPIAQFPGSRNWGYDGVYPYAAQASYGGPQALKRLVNACHREGLAVTLDVVYNHLGPEGNYLSSFGPYFTDHYKTPWGQALNFDGPHSGHVRNFFIQSALYWITDCHVDGLRVDAVHAIIDASAQPFLGELTRAVQARAEQLGRQVHVVAESDLNDVRVLNSREQYDLAFDAQWSDDFHHSLHTLLTGERQGYYMGFGAMDDLAKSFTQSFVYDGKYSEFRRRKYGNSAAQTPVNRFVVFSQNHDQIGNRLKAERLIALAGSDGAKLAAAVVLLSPFLPLLFMGEEYGETAPFHYFTSHGDRDLIEAVRKGRRDEFAAFAWEGEAPDPQAGSTFAQCILNPSQKNAGKGREIYEFYRELIRLRKTLPGLQNPSRENMKIAHQGQTLTMERWNGGDRALAIFHFADETGDASSLLPTGNWRKVLDSSGAAADSLQLAPKSAMLFAG